MGQLRATVRAYARLDLPPDELLRLLDIATRDISESTIVTCVYAVCDPTSRTLTYANAGHLPPLLTPPEGATVRLERGDPPLGSGRAGRTSATVDWLPGSRLTLYTDGLVEHRGSDLDVGIDRLTKALDTVEVPIEAVPNVLVEQVLPHVPDDDVAVLTAAARTPAEHGLHLTVPQRSGSVALARNRSARALSEWGVPAAVLPDTLLVVSELVTNAVRYGKPPIRLFVRQCDGELVLTVSDGSPAQPQVRPEDAAAPNGRGMHIIEQLTTSWGTRPTGLGKAVWCTIAVPDRE